MDVMIQVGKWILNLLFVVCCTTKHSAQGNFGGYHNATQQAIDDKALPFASSNVVDGSSSGQRRRTTLGVDQEHRMPSTLDLAQSIRGKNMEQGRAGSRIKVIALIAERHSGSTWMYNLLSKAFPTLKVQKSLCMYKHWFQDRARSEIMKGTRKCFHNDCFSCHHPEQTLVINLWRNPYDWLIAMNEIPWHAASHGFEDGPFTNTMLPFATFLKKPWKVQPQDRERIKRYLSTKKQQTTRNNFLTQCIDNFKPKDLDFACGTRLSLYETATEDQFVDGDVYAGPYELRLAKIRDFIAVKKWAPHFFTLNYESLLLGGYNGLASYLGAIAEKYNLKHQPLAYKKMIRGNSYQKFLTGTFYGSKGQTCKSKKHTVCPYKADAKALQIVQAKFDEELESLVGYHKVNTSIGPMPLGKGSNNISASSSYPGVKEVRLREQRERRKRQGALRKGMRNGNLREKGHANW